MARSGGRRKHRLTPLGVVIGGAAVAAGAGVAYLDSDRRHQLERQARVWRLTARRAFHWGALRVRGRNATEQERQALEARFAIKTAEDVAQVLGGMKGAIMKAGQMMSFIAEGLPPEAQAALATLQADVPPMAPSLAEKVVRDELGDEPRRLFLDWDPAGPGMLIPSGGAPRRTSISTSPPSILARRRLRSSSCPDRAWASVTSAPAVVAVTRMVTSSSVCSGSW